MDQGPAGLQSPTAITYERAVLALSRTRDLIGWVKAHLGQITPEVIDIAIQLNAILGPLLEEYFRKYGDAAGFEVLRQVMAWGPVKRSVESSTAGPSPDSTE